MQQIKKIWIFSGQSECEIKISVVALIVQNSNKTITVIMEMVMVFYRKNGTFFKIKV